MKKIRQIYQLAIAKKGHYELYPQNLPKVLVLGRAIIFNKNKEVLFLQRSEMEYFDKGKWELPGGKLDKNEDDLIDATRREVQEETGILIQPRRVFVVTFPTDIENKKYQGFLMLNYIEIAHAINKEVKLSAEHENYKWINLSKMNKNEIAPPTLKIIDYYLNKLGNYK